MPFSVDRRGLLLRAAAAFRRAAAALARRARGSAPGGGAPPAAPPAGEDVDFLEHVRGTLLDLSAGPGQERPPPAPPPRRAWARAQTGLRRAAAFLERARRHEDVVLAVVLLAGIAVMILHWVR